ncbi:uncharacterized protein [Haliotis cracherodii]|uniref:uncharacterized protein n=1 Tax=Haliotis cracherodii TaxID=6455 RepID=UPI0039E98D5B
MASHHSGSKRRHLETVENTTPTLSHYWPRFLVIEALDKEPIKLNPFAISKGIIGICGEVTKVTKLRSGSLFVECAWRQQSINLLDLYQFVNIKLVVSVHKTLNSCKGIVHDRARCLSDMSKDDIAKELDQQSVTAVKRFAVKRDGVVQPTNTYLLTFARTTIPESIKAGYCNIGVEVYIPNPLWCYTCQAFGLGSESCHPSAVCYCCGDKHEATDCRKDVKCANCGGNHMASAKSCPVWKRQIQIIKVKAEQNVSYNEVKKRVAGLPSTTSTLSYSAAVSRPPVTTASIDCQADLTWVRSVQPLHKPAATTSSVTHKNKTVKNVESQTPKQHMNPKQNPKQK